MSSVDLNDPGLRVLDLLGHAVWITDPEAGRIEWANEAALALWRAASREELGTREMIASPTVPMQCRPR